jgi:hypothetical protein
MEPHRVRTEPGGWGIVFLGMAWARTLPYFLLTAIGWAAGAGVSSAEGEEEFALPEEPGAVVLSLDVAGGYEPPRIGTDPRIAVFADGKIRVAARYEGEAEVEARLGEGDVAALVRFAVGEQDLFGIDGATVEASMRAEAGLGVDPLPPEGAPDTVIAVRLRGREKTVQQTALDFAVARYPRIGELARIKAVAERIESVAAIAVAGGSEAAEGIVALANGVLAERFSRAPRLAVEHLRVTSATVDGARVFRMTRREGAPLPSGYVFVSAQVRFPPRGVPEVSAEAR